MANDFFHRASSKRVMIGGLALVCIVVVLIWSFACAWHDWHASTLTTSQSDTRLKSSNISLAAAATSSSSQIQHSPSLVSGVFVFDDDDKNSNTNTFVLTRTTTSDSAEPKTFLDYLFGCTERTNALCASNTYVFSLRDNPQTTPLVCRIAFSPKKGTRHSPHQEQQKQQKQQQLSKTKTQSNFTSVIPAPTSVSSSINCQKGRLLDNAPQLAIHHHHQRHNNKVKRWVNDNITKHHPATDSFQQAIQELVAPIPADAKLFEAKFVAQKYKWYFQLCENDRPRWVVKNKQTKETTVYLPVVEVETKRLFFIPQDKAYFLPSLFQVDKIKFQNLDSNTEKEEKEKEEKDKQTMPSRIPAYARYAETLAESGRIDVQREEEEYRRLPPGTTIGATNNRRYRYDVDDDENDDKEEGHVLRELNKTREFREHYASIQRKRMIGVLESHKQKWSDTERRKMHQILSEERQDTPYREREETHANQDELLEREMEESTHALVLSKYQNPTKTNSTSLSPPTTKARDTISQPHDQQTLRKSISREYQSRYSAAERAKAEQEDGEKDMDGDDDLLLSKLYDNNQKRKDKRKIYY